MAQYLWVSDDKQRSQIQLALRLGEGKLKLEVEGKCPTLRKVPSSFSPTDTNLEHLGHDGLEILHDLAVGQVVPLGLLVALVHRRVAHLHPTLFVNGELLEERETTLFCTTGLPQLNGVY